VMLPCSKRARRVYRRFDRPDTNHDRSDASAQEGTEFGFGSHEIEDRHDPDARPSRHCSEMVKLSRPSFLRAASAAWRPGQVEGQETAALGCRRVPLSLVAWGQWTRRPAMRLAQFEVVTLFVPDIVAARAFYERVFEVPVVYADEVSAVLGFEGSMVNLLAESEAPPLVTPLATGSGGPR